MRLVFGTPAHSTLFSRLHHQRSVLRRCAALVAGLALMNVLVVPEASACERDGGASQAMPGMDHADMDAHQSRHEAATMAPADGATAAGSTMMARAGGGSGCQHPGGPCSTACALMSGCTAPAFIAPSLTNLLPMRGAMTALAPAGSWQGRDSAPDIPPPRA